jgi:hypothetical protein
MNPANSDVYADPAQVLRRFIADMNTWELRIAATYKGLPPEEHQAFWTEARDTLREIFARWCTPKERKHGRLGSFQDPPEYQPDMEDVGETVVESPRRASVYTQRRSGFGFQQKYVLVKQDGRWLLDSVKWRAADSEKWSNGVL